MKIINDSEIETVSVEDLKVHPNNPRKGNLKALSESLEVNGFYGAIIAQKSTGYILAGNHRYMASREKGVTELPVIWVDVDENQAKKILLADNRTSDLAIYDEEELADLLQSLDNLEGVGYSEKDLNMLLGIEDNNDDDHELFEAEFRIVVTCKDEQNQVELFEKLKGEGYECQLLML